MRIGKAKNQGKPGETIAVDLNGKTVQAKAGNEINSGKVLVADGVAFSESSPHTERSQSNIKRKRPKKKIRTTTYPIKVLAVIENDDDEVYEFWLYGDRKSPKKVYELAYYNPDSDIPQNEMTGRYIDTAVVYNSGEKEGDYLIFIKWYDYEFPVNPPQEILELDPTREGWLGGYQGVLIDNTKQVLITEYVDYLTQVGDHLTIFPENYISPATGEIYNDSGFDVENRNIEILYQWPKHGDVVQDDTNLNIWVISDIESSNKLIEWPSIDFSLDFQPLSIEETITILNPFSKGGSFIETVASPSISSFELQAIPGKTLLTNNIDGYYIYFEWVSDDRGSSIHDYVQKYYRGWTVEATSLNIENYDPSLLQLAAHSVEANNTNHLFINYFYPLRRESNTASLTAHLSDPVPKGYGGDDNIRQSFLTRKSKETSFLGMVLFNIDNMEPIELPLEEARSFMNVQSKKDGRNTYYIYRIYSRDFIDTTVDFFGVEKTFYLSSLYYDVGFGNSFMFYYWSKTDIPFLVIKGRNSYILGRWHGIKYFDGGTEDTREYSYALYQITEDGIIETAIADFSVLEKNGKLDIPTWYFTLKGNQLFEVIEDVNLTKSLSGKTKVNVKTYLINDEGVIEEKAIKKHEVLKLGKTGEIWSASFLG